jgi:hypothetical protein
MMRPEIKKIKNTEVGNETGNKTEYPKVRDETGNKAGCEFEDRKISNISQSSL